MAMAMATYGSRAAQGEGALLFLCCYCCEIVLVGFGHSPVYTFQFVNRLIKGPFLWFLRLVALQCTTLGFS